MTEAKVVVKVHHIFPVTRKNKALRESIPGVSILPLLNVISTGSYAHVCTSRRGGSILMAINPNRTVVGLFDERGLADNAVNALEQAGFTSDQLYYSGPGENPQTTFWQGIRSFIAREDTSTKHELDRELKELGFSDDEIDHYRREFEPGRTIVAVRAAGREEEALAILRENGAHN
jgi:hypothetical protein